MNPSQEVWQVFSEARLLLEKGALPEARAFLREQETRAPIGLCPEEASEAALLWAWLFYRENSYTEAISKARQAYNGYRLSTNHGGAAESLYLLGVLSALTGELRQAEKFLLDALASYRRAADQSGISKTYSELARVAFVRSDLKAAEEHLLESLEAARLTADSAGEARAWGNLGRVYFLGGRWEEAEKSLRLALLVNQVTGSPASLARNHLSLGYLYFHRGRLAEGEKELERAYKLIVSENLSREEAIYHEYRGEAYFWQNEWVKAEEEYSRALEKGRRLAPQSGLVTQVERRWAELFLALGRPGQAFSRAEGALELARILGETEEVLACLRVMAQALTETGEMEKAKAYLEQAFSLLPANTLPLEEARLKILALALLGLAEEGRARQYLDEVRRFYFGLETGLVFGPALFWSAEKLLEQNRLLLAGSIAELLQEAVARPVFGFTEEKKNLLLKLSQRISEKKLTLAFSENRYALFLNWGKSGSLERKLISLAEKMEVCAVWLCGYLGGRKAFLAKSGSWPEEFDPVKTPELKGPALSVGGQEKPVSLLSLPLELEGEKLGELYFGRQGRLFSQEEMNLAAAAASFFALELSHEAKKDLERENERLLATLEEKCAFPNIITQSPSFRSILEAAARVKDSDLSILFLGETGTGKDLLAKTVHFQSERREGRFVSVNCAALPETLLESELFGHRRGAFTGADRDKPGLFEEADGGTFYLDEVTEIPLSVQAKLLRVLEEKEVVRLGETRPRKVNVRLISAGNKDLKALTEQGLFRQDLYYRLSAFSLRLPPLRERREDIPLLLEHFSVRYGEPKKLRLEPAAFELLVRYDWPGNIRELENEVRKLAVLADEGGLVPARLLSPKFLGADEGLPLALSGNGFSLYGFLAESEKRHIERALAQTGGVKKRAAELLNIPESTLRLKLKAYGIPVPSKR